MCHQTFSHSDLVEGNWTPTIGADTTHGNSGWMVYFRNDASGRNSLPHDTGEGAPALSSANLRAAYSDALTQESSFVGNVLHGADAGGGLGRTQRPLPTSSLDRSSTRAGHQRETMAAEVPVLSSPP